MDDVTRSMTALFTVHQQLCDMSAYDELRAMATTHAAAEAAEVLIAWHKAHTGRYAPPTGKRVSPDRFLHFCGDSEAARVAYTWQFYANHLPGLFEDTDWLQFKRTLDALPKIEPRAEGDLPELGNKRTVFLSTNFKNHANHAWLRWFVLGNEHNCMFISPIPLVQDGSSQSAWYAAQDTYYLPPQATVKFLNRAIDQECEVFDLDCLTNDLTPAIIASLDAPERVTSIIGYAHPEGKHSTTLEPTKGFVKFWRDLHDTPRPKVGGGKTVLFINAAPIKWGSVDMEGMKSTLTEWFDIMKPIEPTIIWRKASPGSWYVKELSRVLDMSKVSFSNQNLPRPEYNRMMSQCTHYLEPSGVGTFSCLMDAHAAGLYVGTASGERSPESKVLLNELFHAYPEALPAYPHLAHPEAV